MNQEKRFKEVCIRLRCAGCGQVPDAVSVWVNSIERSVASGVPFADACARGVSDVYHEFGFVPWIASGAAHLISTFWERGPEFAEWQAKEMGLAGGAIRQWVSESDENREWAADNLSEIEDRWAPDAAANPDAADRQPVAPTPLPRGHR